MTDKIVGSNDPRWTHEPYNKGVSKYNHLLDGKARELNMRDYGHTDVNNFRIVLMKTARDRGLQARSRVLDGSTLLFQVIT